MPDERGPPLDYTLSPRDRTILTLVSHGLGNREIAAYLGLSENTVTYRLKLLAVRWGVQHSGRSSAGLVGIGYRSGAIFVPLKPQLEDVGDATQRYATRPDDVEEDEWTRRLRLNGFELTRLPEYLGDHRHAMYQRRAEDEPRRTMGSERRDPPPTDPRLTGDSPVRRPRNTDK